MNEEELLRRIREVNDDYNRQMWFDLTIFMVTVAAMMFAFLVFLAVKG